MEEFPHFLAQPHWPSVSWIKTTRSLIFFLPPKGPRSRKTPWSAPWCSSWTAPILMCPTRMILFLTLSNPSPLLIKMVLESLILMEGSNNFSPLIKQRAKCLFLTNLIVQWLLVWQWLFLWRTRVPVRFRWFLKKMVELKLREIFLLFLIIPIFVQVGLGSLVITIVDVNDFPPAFDDPAWTPQSPMVLIAYSLLFFSCNFL